MQKSINGHRHTYVLLYKRNPEKHVGVHIYTTIPLSEKDRNIITSAIKYFVEFSAICAQIVTFVYGFAVG